MGRVLNSVSRIWHSVPAAAALIIAAVVPSLAQITDAARIRMQNESKREAQLTAGTSAAPRSVDPKRLKATMDQIEEDFKRILMLHNELGRAAGNADSLDYGFVADAAGEIRKRASRLRTTLALDVTQGAGQNVEKPKEFRDDQVKEAIVELCGQIESFVKNPVIEFPGTVDAQQTARAGRDLENVIGLSGRIKKNAEKLARASR